MDKSKFYLVCQDGGLQHFEEVRGGIREAIRLKRRIQGDQVWRIARFVRHDAKWNRPVFEVITAAEVVRKLKSE